MKLDFVKGHMGGNTITILDGRQMPKGGELETALEVINERYLCSHEAGILYPGKDGSDLELGIVGRASRKFISACGGLTQVLGKALASTDWSLRFDLSIQGNSFIRLGTPAGITQIRITGEGEEISTETEMTSFLEEIHELGVETVFLCGVKSWRIGKFLVIHADDLRRALPDSDIENLDGSSRDKIVAMQKEFLAGSPRAGLDLALYDNHPVREGNIFRVVFPHSIPNGLIEPSCGTGSVAVAVAAFQEGSTAGAGARDGSNSLIFRMESGGDLLLGGPDISSVAIILAKEEIEKVFFSHDKVEITCGGWIGFH
jgi:hypothetical protein